MHTRTVSTKARDVLPDPAMSAVRTAALGWGAMTASWRMLPHFVVAGAQRSGTTTLFRMLSEHPGVIRPTLSKGTGYFDDGYRHGQRWYHAHFPLRHPHQHPAPVTFECSGYYMFHPHAPYRIAAELPEARVVVMLRDPVERAYSAYQHEFARGFEPLRDFEVAVELEKARTAEATRRLEEDETYVSFAHRHYSYLARGEYDVQLARLYDALGRDRVFVMQADRFFAMPAIELSRLQRWLGLQVWLPDVVPRTNAQPRTPLRPAVRARLRAYFEPHDAALADLIGEPPIWRTSDGFGAPRRSQTGE